MSGIGPITLTLIIINVLVTYTGLRNPVFFNQLSFNVGRILKQRDFKRIITSAFLHGDWNHLFFNMFTLFIFSGQLEGYLGVVRFLAVYFGSLIGGNLLALYIHRNHPHYTAIGASGAVTGLVFASIGLFPGMELAFVLLPFYFPAWMYGIGYVLYSIYGIRSQRDNIGHEAHLGGGVTGLLITIAMMPGILYGNPLPIGLILIPTVIFLFILIQKPHILWGGKKTTRLTPDEAYNVEQAARNQELNRLLEKINTHGYQSLTAEEEKRLKELSE